MFFWGFMLLSVLILPFTMIILGKRLMNKPPSKINDYFGYRTNRSMKNNETWEFANKYCGKLWYYYGIIMLPISIFIMIFIANKHNNYNLISIVGGVLTVIQIIAMISTIFFVESALKYTFEDNE